MRISIFISIFICAFAAFFSTSAEAVVRRVYFTQTGRNTAPEALSNMATRPVYQSVCTMYITNPSSVSQTFDLAMTLTGSTIYTSRGPYSASPATGTTAFTSASCVPAGVTAPNLAPVCSISVTGISVAAGATSAAYVVRAPEYHFNGIGQQDVICSGSVTATDPIPASPGFLIATGTMNTFSASSRLLLSSATNAAMGSQARQAIYIQVPVAVNEGRPF